MKKTDLINELFKAKVISIIGAEKIEEIIQDIRKSLENYVEDRDCLLYTSPSPRDATRSAMRSSA